MAFSMTPPVEKIPVTLTLLQLEMLALSCRLQQLSMSFRCEVTAPFRYELHQARPLPDSPHNTVCVLRSNDAMDVTRFLGLDFRMQEPGYPNATSRPTECWAGLADGAKAEASSEGYVVGPVPMKHGMPTPLLVKDLPRKEDGALDHASPQFRDRCNALYVKSGQPMMNCKKALHRAEGDGERALAILALPSPFCSTI